MTTNEAHIGWNREGDMCRVWVVQDEEQGAEPLTGWHDKGRRPLSPEVNDHFMGRQRFDGAIGMLRGIGSYVVLNALSPVGPIAMQQSWESILGAVDRLKLPSRGRPPALAALPLK